MSYKIQKLYAKDKHSLHDKVRRLDKSRYTIIRVLETEAYYQLKNPCTHHTKRCPVPDCDCKEWCMYCGVRLET